VVHAWDIAGEPRPRWTHGEGVRSMVRSLGDRTGLTHMGVNLRTVEPGDAGTNRHFHTVEEEWVYVLGGLGTVRIGPHRLPVRAGTFVGFPPGPRPHHFLAEGHEPLALLEGGERRPREDVGCYVDVPRWWHGGTFLERSDASPPEEGDPSQCIHVDELAAKSVRHDLDSRAGRSMKRLNRRAGLTRQAVVWSRVAAGDRSTAFHMHERTDEWVFVLDGRAHARVGEERFEIGPHDFLGHPAGGAAHVMEAITSLTYLMGGEINREDDVVVYPEAGIRRSARTGEILGRAPDMKG
jgi:uncharacterized cupin superfamily protein